MRMYDIIHKKREGGELSHEELAFFVNGFTAGKIPDYQASALMMAVFFKGMTDRETVSLTELMACSGDTVDLSCFGNLSVDKHSTGGVGDKTTLIVAPVVASLGGYMAKMSGRGLGHTGGTVDKLESIPGYKTSLSQDEFISQVKKVGIAVIGQSGNMTPADKKLYALRDVTATVDSIPLITSSIMSKKLAAGAKNIVLDVKAGSGAFMKNVHDAEKLAHKMVDIGKSCGRNMAALVTDMDCPLGFAVGNSLEVCEAVSVLSGKSHGDLYEVCMALSANIISLFKEIPIQQAQKEAEEAVSSGRALLKMREWIGSQGGDVSFIDNPLLFEKAEYEYDVLSRCDGYVSHMDAESIGTAAVILGAGRAFKEDKIDFSAGIILNKKCGDSICKGEKLCTLCTNRREALAEAEEKYFASVKIGNEKVQRAPMILKIIR